MQENVEYPDLYCDLLLNIPSFSSVLLPPCPEHSRQHLRALGTKSTCFVNLFGRKDKVGEEQRRRESGKERLRIDISKNEELHAKWGFLTFHVPVQDSLFQFL